MSECPVSSKFGERCRYGISYIFFALQKYHGIRLKKGNYSTKKYIYNSVPKKTEIFRKCLKSSRI